MLTQAFAAASARDVLEILRNEGEASQGPRTGGNSMAGHPSTDLWFGSTFVSPLNAQVLRLLHLTRALSIISLSSYAVLQLGYGLVVFNEQPRPITYATVFGLALATKLLHGLTLPLWLVADLRERLESLREKSIVEELGMLVGSVEHDTKSALAMLRMDLDNIRHKYQHDHWLLSRLQRMSQHADRITAATDIIPLVREIGTGLRERLVETNVIAIVRSAAEAVRRVDRAGDVRVNLDASRSEVMVWADPPRLMQAFVNIITNGIEASRATHATNPRVLVRCSTSRGAGAEVEIVVHDDGLGLSPDVVERASRSKPFFTTKGGTGRNRGMGLFIASRVIHAHLGNLRFESDGARYTDAIVTLPIASARE